MTDVVEIPLHKDTPPGFSDVVGWAIGANFFVLTTVTIVFVLLPWMSGHQPTLDAQTLTLAGATAVALLLGFMFVAFRRHRRRAVATPSAHLRFDGSVVEVVAAGQQKQSCARDEFVARPVHAHESLRGVDYYMGPALQLTVGDATWVVAHLDGKKRWAFDPPALTQIDWICGRDAWSRLLEVEDLAGDLVSYDD